MSNVGFATETTDVKIAQPTKSPSTVGGVSLLATLLKIAEEGEDPPEALPRSGWSTRSPSPSMSSSVESEAEEKRRRKKKEKEKKRRSREEKKSKNRVRQGASSQASTSASRSRSNSRGKAGRTTKPRRKN